MLSLVDTALMGHLPEAEIFLAAVAVGAAIFNFVYWAFGFLRMGATGLTAQAYGAGDAKAASLVLGRAFLTGLAGGLVVILLQWPIGELAFSLMNGSEAALQEAETYFDIRIWAAPATIGLYAVHGWFLGMQNAWYPLLLALTANGLNLGFNLLFVQGLGMEADGIALGTVIAQYGGLLLGIILILKKYPEYVRRIIPKELLDWQALKRFFGVNADIFIRTLCLVFAMNYFIAKSGDLGDDVLSANSLLMQLLTFMAFMVDGFAFAAESLIGKAVGAARLSGGAGLGPLIRRLIVWGMGFGIFFALLYELLGPVFLGWLTYETEIVQLAGQYIHWLALTCVAGSLAYLWDGIYLGATRTRPLRDSMVVAAFVVFLPLMYFLGNWLENDGFWLALLAFMLARGLALSWLSRKVFAEKE